MTERLARVGQPVHAERPPRPGRSTQKSHKHPQVPQAPAPAPEPALAHLIMSPHGPSGRAQDRRRRAGTRATCCYYCWRPSRALALFSLSLLILAQLIAQVRGQQYQRSALSQAQNLVSQLQQQQPSPPSYFGGTSAALVRSPQAAQLQSADLDNVIESTTASSSSVVVGSDGGMSAFAFNSRPFQSQQQQSACQLPSTWAGRWYQANKEPVRVTNTEISDKGVCRDSKGDKYLFEFTSHMRQQAGGANHMHHAHQHPQHLQQQQQQPQQQQQQHLQQMLQQQQQPQGGALQASSCLICLVINERHLNVLQYKESSCQPVPAQYLNKSLSALIADGDTRKLLDSICSDITGDAQLESLFRLDTPPIECPIAGKFQFAYDNCREPHSALDSCIDKKQLHFKFSACAEAPGSESKSEVLRCFADWQEGNNYYMIGRLESANQQDRGKFRCFLYERAPDGSIQMAQSLEESCYGLINAAEGPKTLRLSARAQPSQRCQLPAYIASESEKWLSVDNSLVYAFDDNSTKFQVRETNEGTVIEEATCLQQISLPSTQAQQQQPYSLQARYATRSGAPTMQAATTMATPTNRRYPPSSSHLNQVDQTLQQQQQQASSARLGDVVYLVQITKNCYTTDYCVRFHRRTSGIVQIDYFIALPGGDGQQRCRNAYTGTPQTQIITSTNLEQQRCPFEGVFAISAPAENDHSFNPSNLFVCPRSSQLLAQCDQPSHLRIQYQCSLSTPRIAQKNLYCLGSWTLANGLVRVILADDERKRYSAWYKDHGPLLAGPDASADPDQAAAAARTRSQQLLGLSPGAGPSSALGAPAAQIIDLQMTLITAQPTISKTMQVRLTRRAHCADLHRHYASQGLFASISVPSYASPASAASGCGAPARLAAGSGALGLALLLAFASSLLTGAAGARRTRPTLE